MVDEDAEAARRYRQRAREVRALAKNTEDWTTRAALFGIARDYEAMALARLRVGKLARAMKRNRLKRPPDRGHY
jgi:hypothetical protein